MAPQHSPAMTLRHGLLNPVALGYLAVVVVVWGWIGVDVLLVEHQDASFAPVWGFLITAPTSLLFLPLPSPSPWVGVVVGAVVQAIALGVAYRWLTSLRQRRTDSA
ncbi:hypothetical protein SAMN05421805_103482 [Saccharopolyspora antimicrobica]|uniref:Uncharacterized protein n=1 Tax=Saccharopolyspora antimicrobica TaxID=455193 RepID=A0A1I4XKD2_9PSEU|nr:hypothetical protein [Saccharopolyspora antimicrobica]RKT84548.1 hypothetical protein ATL45_2866 [Saccharopolyspora antimicrobica]SFN26291.1 hypothetical protein SAMN05421805_103482 [Saccharopolyspora antimicrobica]